MKCSKRDTEAVAVYAYCGRALCNDCIQSPTAPRMVCSNDCAAALTRADQAMQMMLQRSAQSARASAFYCYVSGGLSAAAAVVARFMLASLAKAALFPTARGAHAVRTKRACARWARLG